jgi:putative endopeptidase
MKTALRLYGLMCCACLHAQTGTSGVDLDALDKSVSPCTNFYQFACGTWMKNNPIPADQSRWSRFGELAERNLQVEREILTQAARPDPNRTPIQQKIGDYYGACMDEAAIEKKGIAPLQPTLNAVEAVRGRGEITGAVIRLHREGIRMFFSLQARPDEKDASKYIAMIGQGGLTLPDRDYYLKDDPGSTRIREQYRAHVRKMIELLDQAAGDSAAGAEKDAAAVLAIETALARNSMDRVAMRNPTNVYHKMTVEQLAALAPDFGWREYLGNIGIAPVATLNVMQPDFIRGLAGILRDTSLDELKAYMRWRALDSSANEASGIGGRTSIASPLVPKALADENWNFNIHILNGTKEQPPRWKTCTRLVDASLGEALGQEYIKVAFSPASKQRMLAMVGEIEAEMAKVIQTADWMSPATRTQALAKLHDVANKIGYPEKWRDYSQVKISPGDAFGNARRARMANIAERLQRVGKPVDKAEWSMTPPTVNAYYSPPENNINFPAGILQPPFFNPDAADAVNYGAIGTVIGHELTHGFDDQGRRYDGQGNLRDWWTPADAKAFEKRADCVAREYGKFSPAAGVTLNGRLTLGENAADNGGIRLTYMALMDKLAGHPLEKADGFTPQQQFFLGFAQIYCGAETAESARRLALTDPHSPGKFRVQGVLQNLPEFSSAWGCKTGDAMVAADPCRVW